MQKTIRLLAVVALGCSSGADKGAAPISAPPLLPVDGNAANPLTSDQSGQVGPASQVGSGSQVGPSVAAPAHEADLTPAAVVTPETADAGNVTAGDKRAGPMRAGGTPAMSAAMPPPEPSFSCAQRVFEGTAAPRFHHVHFNTTEPAADLAFFEKFRDAPPVDFCKDESSDMVTRATRTERGYFLYTQVDEAPDITLDTYLEHVGWIHPNPGEELARLVALGVPLYPEGRNQCADAAAGIRACAASIIPDYFFYLLAPSGARIEIALGPGPATSGFGHVHLIQGVDLTFFETVSDGSFMDGAIDVVNHTDVSLTEDMLSAVTVVDTRGRPIDHIAYSTTELEAARDRITAAGIEIQEDIAFKPTYGFRSFFVRSPKGIWVEMVEDSPFEP